MENILTNRLNTSAMEQYLVRTKKRTAVSLVLESGEPRDVHQFAALLGYGARAVNPYLAQECIEELIDRGMLDKDPTAAINDYNSAVLHGIVKIASKMGVSTVQSYQSSQIFEAVGIRQDVIDKYFTNTVSLVGGIGLEEIGEGVVWRHSHAFDPIAVGGRHAGDVGEHGAADGDLTLFRMELNHENVLSFPCPDGREMPAPPRRPGTGVRIFRTLLYTILL